MIPKIFDKWTLNFSNKEFESLYEEHRGKMRIQSFQIFNGLGIGVTILVLIILIIQQQPYYLMICMSGGTIVCFCMLLISKFVQKYLGILFSILYIGSIVTNIMISAYGIEVPQFVFGFSVGFVSIGLIEYSLNRIKLIYIAGTPLVMFSVFNLYNVEGAIYMIILIGCTVFLGIQLHINEYNNRSAFSLNLIVDKQRDIINEFVSDPMIALSFDNRSEQFILEYYNNKCHTILDIQETNQMKQFLRQCQTIQQTSKKDQKLLNNSCIEQFITKVQKLTQNFSYQSIQQQQLFQISVRIMNYGRPILLLIIRNLQENHLFNDSEKRITSIQNVILNQSKFLINSQLKILKISNKLKIPQGCKLNVLQCLKTILSSLNRKQPITQNSLLNNQRLKFNYFLTSIEKYIKMLSLRFNKTFQIDNFLSESFIIQLNTKLLSQILINLFEKAFMTTIRSKVILSVQIEKNQNVFLSKQKYGLANTTEELISFTFTYSKKQPQNTRESSKSSESDELIDISDQATNYLICLLGPYNQVFQTCRQNKGLEIYQIKFYVYPFEENMDVSYFRKSHHFQPEKKSNK